MLKIIPPRQNLVHHIIDNLRTADIDEIKASTGQLAKPQIYRALERSGPCHMAAYNGKPMALFGIADLNGFSKIGSPWLVGTPEIETQSIAFLKKSKPLFHEIAAPYDYLVNMVDTRNKASIRWISWLGFTLHSAAPYGPEGLPFHKFDMNLPAAS